MITDFAGKIAVITGAASGLGLACAHKAAALGMHLALVDLDEAGLDRAAGEFRSMGTRVLCAAVDVSNGTQMEELAAKVESGLGVPHLLFNNAGVITGGLVWESSERDWQWLLGVDLWGVVHGTRVFTPRMLTRARSDPSYRGHIVNTSSMAGLLATPNMGIYNAAKAAVVSLSETLYQDLRLVTDQIGASLLCPYFIPTGIATSGRRDAQDGEVTPSQLIGQAMLDKAVRAGKVSAGEVAEMVFDAVREDRFYIFSHPRSLGGVSRRHSAILTQQNPPDPFEDRPEIGRGLRDQLRSSGSTGTQANAVARA